MTRLGLRGAAWRAGLAAALGAGPAAAPSQPADAFAVLTVPQAGAGVCVPAARVDGPAPPFLRYRQWRLASADSTRVRTITSNEDQRPGGLTSFSDYTRGTVARPGAPEESVGASFRAGVVAAGRQRRLVPAPPGAPGEFRRTPLTPDELARVRALLAWLRTRCPAS